MSRNSLKDTNILVTGFEGFLGSHLTKKLISLGTHVLGLDIKVHRKNTILTKDDYKNITVIKGSVTCYKLLKQILSRYKIRTIFHLAAEALVEQCRNNPLCTFSSNIEGTWTVLEACRESKKINTVIIASSDKAYGINKDLPYTETTPLKGIHPYDVSKSCADLAASCYHHTYKVPVIITRCGNIYGPGDFNFSRIIPDTLKSIFSHRQLRIRSNGKFTRDYVYVDDIVDGYILLAKKSSGSKLFGQAFNFSNEKPLSVIQLVKKLYALAGKKQNYKILNQSKYEIPHQYLSAKKVRIMLGWRPQYTLDEGLAITASWYRNYFNTK